ncbi:MAG: ATP-grasp domain-containing protein [Bacilli bacterium]|nr:ATP-grasp domain-containing protein [Bacilli bacterium]
MAINGYLIYNITQKNQTIFKSQIKAYVDAFRLEHVKLKLIDNLHALSVIKKEKKVDFVLFWDKDIALVYQLLNLNIKVFNNVDALRLCDDKAYSYAQFNQYKIPTPKTIVLPLTFFEDLSKYFIEIKKLIKLNNIHYPLIVKERRNSLGLGVYLIHSDIELKKVLESKWQRELLIQEYINNEYGKDYRVYLVNHRPKAVVSRTNKKDFRSNVELGGVMKIIKKPDEALLRIAMRSSLALKLDFGAVDIVRDKNNKYLVLEVNSNARTATIDRISKKSLTREVAKYILNNL